ncbi:hypothetical protein KPL76_06295 [Subtercola sp. PAMC28395]|uniref:DNA methyltransferase n=1 Tax=Subtercola sp. PAMC28395 TaxID=2846775 RepID=UPI001C0DE56A|nr:DNA methyltransferase [Subtercola sp. PAMC28395]QWT24964.1 hypothetical protein KPL76_06295 [Subtercola sp. PAMC28395]
MSLLTLNTGADTTLTYADFLREKVAFDKSFGFEIDPAEVNPMLKPHQRDIVCWAVRGGRRAIFAKFGLGKTVMQIEVLRLIMKHRGGSALVVLPLDVRIEFARDAAMLGVQTQFIQTTAFGLPGEGLYLTNYESVREGKVDVNLFIAASLDEASVLRDYGSKTFQTFLTLFKHTEYRFVATALPAPNRHKELIHYAAFLSIMDSGAALTRFFQRDSSKAGNLTIYPHKIREFHLWLNTWAVFLQRPSDLGYSDEGYDLPDFEVNWHEVGDPSTYVKTDRDGQAVMYADAALGIVDAARVKRDSIGNRVARLTELVNASPEDHFLLWHHLEDERHEIVKALPETVDVYGSQDRDLRAQRVIDFSDGKFRLLATKPSISGSGSNFQRHCHRAIFVGVNYSFDGIYQSIHRIHRYLQTENVIIDFIHTESERGLITELLEKWKRDDELTERMSDVLREFGLNPSAITAELTREMGIEREVSFGADWKVALNDCVVETADHMETDSIDMILTSIPFGNHYEYSLNYSDFGHTDNNAHFWWQNDYLTPNLLRVLKPGRILAVHVKDRINFGNVTGAGLPTVSPFHAEAIAHYTQHGFDYMGMITITTDVVRENNQTYRLGYTKMRKDGSNMGVGSPEYVLLFHKPQTDRSKGWADERVVKEISEYSLARWQIDAAADWRSSGDRLLSTDELAALKPEIRSRLFTDQSMRSVYDFDAHVALGEAMAAKNALPATFASLSPGSWSESVWHDINRLATLNGEQSRRNLEFHICPLQFDIVDRLIERYTNPGELVYDPFGGLGTVPLRARKLGRRGRMAELNPTSYRDAVMYQREEDRRGETPSLFDLLDIEDSEAIAS